MSLPTVFWTNKIAIIFVITEDLSCLVRHKQTVSCKLRCILFTPIFIPIEHRFFRQSAAIIPNRVRLTILCGLGVSVIVKRKGIMISDNRTKLTQNVLYVRLKIVHRLFFVPFAGPVKLFYLRRHNFTYSIPSFIKYDKRAEVLVDCQFIRSHYRHYHWLYYSLCYPIQIGYG